MNRKAAARSLDRIETQIAQLEAARRSQEIAAFGAECSDERRRERYFALGDETLRRELIARERALHEQRRQRCQVAVEYRNTIVTGTRAKLADLQSDSPTSAWRRGLWWDLLTVFWVLVGAGWLAAQLPGALAGVVAALVCGGWIARRRAPARLAAIQAGETLLRSAESDLQDALREAQQLPPEALFTAAEEAAGAP
ncbi:MAG: hypothetical protein QY320_00195 [Gammaproteobacteria bacterium]|nr:MAG: hypothetical protein QY320_00195 [Gammaproteobacteria bacterium]